MGFQEYIDRIRRAVRLVALLAALAPAAAWAAFDPPITLSAAGQNALDPQVAISANGAALVVWQRLDGIDVPRRILARARSAAGVLSPIQTLSPAPPPDLVNAHAEYHQVAVDADGDALVVWRGFGGRDVPPRILARARFKTGALGPIQYISAGALAGEFFPTAEFPQVAIDADGDALVVWLLGDATGYRIAARARSKAGVLGPIVNLSAGSSITEDPQVAIDADGDALVIWTGFDGTHRRIQARARSKTGVLGPILTLSAAGKEAFEPQVALDGEGDALVAWFRKSDGPFYRIESRGRSKTGVLGPVQILSAAGSGDARDPQVAADVDGDALVVWQRFVSPNYRVQARARSKTGVIGPIQTLSAAGVDTFPPQVALDADGDAVVVWGRDDGTNDSIQARARSAAGVLGPIQTLSPGGNHQVALDADGDALVVWQRRIGTNVRVQAAAGP